MGYPPGAVERAMKVQEVIVRAIAGQLTWIQAAEILGCSARSVRRLRLRLQQVGYEGLFDRRRQRPSPKRAPVADVQRVLALYRDRYQGFNVRHFHQIARREHGVRFCDAFVKRALQAAGVVAKQRARGRHRRRREPRACYGELLHLDGSRHHWLARVPETWFTLITVVDDATKQLLHAELWPGGESVTAVIDGAASRRARAGGADGPVYRSRSLGGAHPDLGHRRSVSADPGGTGAAPARRGAHPELLAAGPRPQ